MSWPAPAAGWIVYDWKCSACGRHAEQMLLFTRGSEIPRPTRPEGWHHVDERELCERHQFRIVTEEVIA
jgi:hypothetical protein